ncbi:modification methylase HpaII [Abditibacteriota bacterium]|nr:modification methylase HpaII [Abditibacteriota bacterium]
MSALAYYNEIEKFPCGVIETNIQRGHLPRGKVHCEDIKNVRPSDLESFRQIHLFAGIGTSAYACRLAGLPDSFSICTFGFPCQDISTAGKGAGLSGKRSGLFFEAVRLIDAARPRWLLAENVRAIRTRGANRVIEELEGIGYSILDPLVLGADDIGATHQRKRVWFVGLENSYVFGRGADLQPFTSSFEGECSPDVEPTDSDDVAHTNGLGSRGWTSESRGCESAAQNDQAEISGGKSRAAGVGVADASGAGLEGFRGRTISTQSEFAMPSGESFQWPARPNESQHKWEQPRTIKSPVGSATDGASKRLVRQHSSWRRNALKGLGNAWVAQVPVSILRWMALQEASLA